MSQPPNDNSVTLYKHRVFCLTELAVPSDATSGGVWVYAWKETSDLLTVCPNDPLHALQPGSPSIVDVRAPNLLVTTKEVGIVTNSHVRTDTVVITAPAGGSGSASHAWDFAVAVYTLQVAVTPDCVGCQLTAEAAPVTPVGVLAADALTGATVLSVSPTALAALTPGLVVTLRSGATTQELGVVTAVDGAAGTVTVKTATASDFLAAGPTVVCMTNRAADRMELPLAGYLTFGSSRTQTVNFPAGRPLVLTLNNPNAAPARLVVHVSYNC